MADIVRFGKRCLTVLGLFGTIILPPQAECQYPGHHMVSYMQTPGDWNPHTQQRNPPWHQFSSPRKRSPDTYDSPYYNNDQYGQMQFASSNQYPQTQYNPIQNFQGPQYYDNRSPVGYAQTEPRHPNDPRLLSDSAFTRISETLGAINTVGHYLVDMVNDSHERNETDPNLQQLPQALYTISKNVLGRNVTDKIAPIVKKALPKVLPDAPITKIATADRIDEDAKSCTTPEGEDGVCEDLSNCPQLLLNLVNLRESLCFKDLFVPGVCCPKDAIVPQSEKPIVASTSKPTYLVPVTTQKPKPATTKKPSAVLVLTTKKPKPATSTKRPPTTTKRPATTSKRPATPTTVTTPRTLPTTSYYTVTPPVITNFSNIVDIEECGQREDEGGRIVGGTEAKPGAWPWMAAIYLHGSKRREFWCGGTLVNKRHILTAAHCTRDSKQRPFPARQFSVRLGDVDLAREDEPSRPVTLRVTAVRAHDQFSRVGFYNDIAVLVLSENVQKSKYVIPICIPRGELTRQTFDGAVATVVGWGTTRYGGGESSKQLEAKLPVWRNEDCNRAYFQPITDTFLCAGYARGGIDACQGDSGGPLMLQVGGRWTQIGVVSFGNKCGEPGYPGVYTRVTHYTHWLQQNTV
ncbi:proclotting enzyme-like isoform X2 [Spodoptera litura]|uniref:Proclotting enzyme-like isoform X1 n=2 Tax=Spodoptera litura TaxID=69820 RepID=A0A9J7IHY7_SPOLT|nr:proclotting enzyme-like isoform X1 [Spodoptera litura]XP_022815847.1 proclotting enzyme-like isoform X2 [Spodoptera litura]